MKSGKASRTDKRVSIASKDVLDIQPVAYSFRVLGGGPGSGSVMTAIRPPYWLYHDHALGVIWMLFHNEKNYIGITQLHWCLRFLLDLKNSQGEYTGDVNICIRVIQDDLIEQYAKLGTALESLVEKNTTRRSKDTGKPAQSPIEEDSQENESILIKEEDQSRNVANVVIIDEIDLTKDDTQKSGKENVADENTQKIAETSTPNEHEEPQTSKIHETHEQGGYSVEQCTPTRCESPKRSKKKEDIVSFTYNEMISSGPAPCTEPYSIVNLFDENIFFDTSKEKVTKTTKPDGAHASKLADSSKKEMVNFLNSSRQQHIESIRKEIESVYELERFMKNINANGFSAYVTEDLARRMESLNNEDVVKEADEMIKEKTN